MNTNCKDKEKFKTAEASTKASLRTKGAIDKYLNILDINLFNKLNKEWSLYAVNKFQIVGRLFINDNGKAVPNKVAFTKIDNAKGIFYSKPLQNKPIINNTQNDNNFERNIDYYNGDVQLMEQEQENFSIENNIIDPNKKCN